MLIPVHANERNPIGLFGLGNYSGQVYEPGYVGRLVATSSAVDANSLPVVDKFTGDAMASGASAIRYASVLIDDSSTGSIGSMFGTSVVGVGAAGQGTIGGPATTLGSRKLSFWTEGLFLTDQFVDPGADAYGDILSVDPMAQMYVTSAGKLTFVSGGAAGTPPISFLAYVNQGSDLLGSLVSANRYGVPAAAGLNAKMILIKFK